MFDIEPVSLGVSILLLLGFIMPIYLYKVKQSKKTSLQKSIFQQSERDLGIECLEKEFWRDYYALGLDSDKKKLLYIKFDPEPEIQVVDLKNCTHVAQYQQTEKINNGKINREIINNIGLKLTCQKSNQPEIHLEFYNGDLFSDNRGEGPLALKWKDLIAQKLRKTT
jgi:hypothetical protein